MLASSPTSGLGGTSTRPCSVGPRPRSIAIEGELAQQVSERALAISEQDPRFLYSRALLEYQLGDREQSDTHLERLLEFIGMTSTAPFMGARTPRLRKGMPTRQILEA